MTNRKIVYVEIPAASREASARFYGDIFGWQLQHIVEPFPYTVGPSGNVGIGMPDIGQDHQPGDVIVFIESDDIDADLKKIEQAGGKIVTPKYEIKGWGWKAMFTDPAGNHLALWTAVPPAK